MTTKHLIQEEGPEASRKGLPRLRLLPTCHSTPNSEQPLQNVLCSENKPDYHLSKKGVLGYEGLGLGLGFLPTDAITPAQ